MTDFEALSRTVAAQVRDALPLTAAPPLRVSVWLRFVRTVEEDGVRVEQTIGNTTRVYMTIGSADDLYEQLAQNILLKVFGEEEQVVRDLPTLVVRILDRKVTVPPPGAPPTDTPDQVYLMVTVYEYQPSLWERMFSRRAGEGR